MRPVYGRLLSTSEYKIFLHTPWRCVGGVEIFLHLFLTSEMIEGEGSASRPGGSSTGKELPLHIELEAGWAP